MKTMGWTVLALVLVAAAVPAGAGEHGRALEGLDRVKAVFDVNQGDLEILTLRLSLIDRTAREVTEAGKKPDFAVVFRGAATRYVTLGDKYVEPWDVEKKAEVARWIRTFHQSGFAVEQCAIAAVSQGIDTRDFPREVTVVPNGYLSLIGYQNQGFGLVPME